MNRQIWLRDTRRSEVAHSYDADAKPNDGALSLCGRQHLTTKAVKRGEQVDEKCRYCSVKQTITEATFAGETPPSQA